MTDRQAPTTLSLLAPRLRADSPAASSAWRTGSGWSSDRRRVSRHGSRRIPAHRSGAAALVALILLAAPGVLAGPGSLEAQSPGSVVGSVTDEVTGEPLEGAVVTVASGDVEARAEADQDGQFVLPDLPVGDVSLRAEHPGYGSVVEQVEVSASDVVFMRMQLPRVEALLDELLVRTNQRSSQELEGEVRRGNNESRTAADLLAHDVPGVQVTWGDGGVGSGAVIRIRGISSFVGPNDPVVLLDGVRIDDRGAGFDSSTRSQTALHTLETIPAESVARIRVLKGPSAAARYADAANGVILVETQGGDDGD